MIDTEEGARQFCAERCDQIAMRRLELFLEMLKDENRRQNLVAQASLQHAWVRHIVDSLQLYNHVPRGTSTAIDLGSGAGFPGVVLAIAMPSTSVTLIESRRKRVEWLNDLVSRLGLSNCVVVGSKLEQVPTAHYDLITARAFAPLEKLLHMSGRFSTRSTVWLLPKGRSAAQELDEQTDVVQNMFHVEQSVTDTDAKILVGKGQITI